MNTADKPDRNGIQVIARAAAVLRSLENEIDGLSLSELAENVGLPRSTVQRIVGALVQEDILVAASGRGRVKLGPAIARLGVSVDLNVEVKARAIMEGLAKSTGETIDLSTLKGNSAVFLDQVLGSLRLIAVSRIGDRFPLHCTANGKALLAALPSAKRAKLLAAGLERHTPQTIVDPQLLQEELEAIRTTGISYDREEHTLGISAVGAAQVDALGRVYAISIPVPTARFAAKREQIADLLLAANREFGIAINGAP